MKKFLFILLFYFCFIQVRAQKIIHAEMLGRPESSKISLHMVFDTLVEYSIHYKPKSNLNFTQSNWSLCNADYIVVLQLSNLLADTKYDYFVQYKKAGSDLIITRPTFSFQTQREKSKSFIYTVQADPHLDEQSDTALYALCLKNQLEDQPDFMIDLGDIFMTDKLRRTGSKNVTRDTIQNRVHLMRSYYEKLSHSVPLFISLGNHEGEAGWNLGVNPENIANWGTLERKKYFINPTPTSFYTGDTILHSGIGFRENYYAWNWGNSLFIVLDPYWYTKQKPDSLNGWRWSLGKVQYDWLKKTLRESRAEFKFVFAHQLIGGDPDGRGGVEFADLYEWGGNNLDGTYGFNSNRPGWDMPIKELLKENKVHIFFHGHDHFFAKQEKECLVYQETPQPSHPNFSNSGQADDYGYFAGQILPNSGHIRCSIQENGVKVEYVRAYIPSNETGNRHNKDVSASYFIGKVNCYDSLSTATPMIWNAAYEDEIVYPNPFSKNTCISFELKQSAQVKLFISNENGQVIKQLLFDNLLSTGEYKIIWDGLNENNMELPNGKYYYSLIINGKKTGAGKIVLIRD